MLQEIQKKVKSLQNEVFKLSTDMEAKEAKLEKLSSQLDEKEELLKTMAINLNKKNVKLSEATSIIEQIATLSQTLADASGPAKAAVLNSETQLIQANYQLLASNRKNLEKELEIRFLKSKNETDSVKLQETEAELEALKDFLKASEVELMKAQRDLGAKDEELNKVLERMEVRESELRKLREEVIEEANGLRMLHVLSQKRGRNGDQSAAEKAIASLELESAKLNAEVAFSALKNLAELGEVLVKDDGVDGLRRDNNLVEDDRYDLLLKGDDKGLLATSSKEVERVKGRVIDRKAALAAAREAVGNLSQLTKSLMEGVCFGSQSNIQDQSQNIIC